jgi:hypothetical protein
MLPLAGSAFIIGQLSVLAATKTIHNCLSKGAILRESALKNQSRNVTNAYKF